MSTYTVFVNFLEDYNRCRAEFFSVNITFDELSNDISHFVVAQNFIISTCLRMSTEFLYFSEIVFFALDKNIHWPTFVSGFSAIYRVSIPGGYPRRSIPLFQALRHRQFLL